MTDRRPTIENPGFLHDDPRPIKRVTEIGIPEDWSYWEVGSVDITHIIGYGEFGERGMTPWIAIFKGQDLILRIPARALSIEYYPTPLEE